MKHSFIFLTYNRPELLNHVLVHHRTPALGNSETIVIDNGNGSAWQVARNYESVRYVKTGYNMGIAAGWNLGLRIAQGEIIFLMEDDILLPDGWFQEATALYDILGDQLGIIAWNAGYRLDTDDPNAHAIDSFAGKSTTLDEYQLYLCPKGDVYGNAFFGRHLLEDIGYFDERYGLVGYTRLDYGFRANYLGYLNGYLLKDDLIDRATHLDTVPDPEREPLMQIARNKYMDKITAIHKMSKPPKHHFQEGI